MGVAENTKTLANFLRCSPESAESLARQVSQRQFGAGAFLCHQGDRNKSLWLILSGTVQLQANSADGQAVTVSTFGPGELIGGHEDHEEEAYDTRALTVVEAFVIQAAPLRALMQSYPDLAKGLARIYAGQLHAVLDRLAARVTLSAKGRFYRELLRAAGDEGTISPIPIVAAIALSAQTTRETGSRALSALERRGIVERHENALLIRSRRLVEEMIV